MNSPKNFTTPILIALLVVAAFFLGNFWTKLQYIEKTASPGTPKVAGEQAANPQAGDSAAAGQAQPTPPTEISQAEFQKLLEGATKVAGNNSAPIKIVEFSDFECPYCARFYQDTLPQIEEKYIKTGKVQFFYRYFPLPFHANAKPAAIAAECANLQGKFKAMHDLLYKNQQNLTTKDLKSYAATAGLNQDQFDSCFDTKQTEIRINSDTQLAQSVGVNGTPAFFINGKIITGAVPFSIFQQTLDSLL